MRKFEVWLDMKIVGVKPERQILFFPDETTDIECEEDCRDCLDTMISNNIDCGWIEVK